MIPKYNDTLAEALKSGLRKPSLDDLEHKIDALVEKVQAKPDDAKLKRDLSDLLKKYEATVKSLAVKEDIESLRVEESADRTNSRVGATILSQLGANKFVAMTGARNFVYGPNSLEFTIGRNSSKANRVRIVLNKKDLYDVHFINYRNLDRKEVSRSEDVQASELRSVFTNKTGLRTSLTESVREPSEFEKKLALKEQADKTVAEAVSNILKPKLPEWVKKYQK